MSTPHPADIIDHGGPGSPDYSYLEDPAPIGTTFVDAFTGGEGDPLPPIGAEPEDGFVRGPNGQLYSVNARANVVGRGAVTMPEHLGSTERITIGGTALQHLNAASGRMYRSTATGSHSQPQSLRSHRAE